MFSSARCHQNHWKQNQLPQRQKHNFDVGFIFIPLFSPQVTGSAAMALISSKLGLGGKD